MTFADISLLLSPMKRALSCKSFSLITLKTPSSQRRNIDCNCFNTFSPCGVAFGSGYDLSEHQHFFNFRHRYCKTCKTVTEVCRSTDTTTNSRENAVLPKVSCEADYSDEFTDLPVEKAFSESFIAKTKKQNHVVEAAVTLLRIGRECSHIFSDEAHYFLHPSVSAYLDYVNELRTLTDCTQNFGSFVRNKLTCLKIVPELIRGTGCAGVEKRNQMYVKEIIEVLQKRFALAKEEKCYHAPSPANTLLWSDFSTKI